MATINFSFDTEYGKFSDSIWYPDDTPLSEAEIVTIKTQRLNSWLAAVQPQQDVANG